MAEHHDAETSQSAHRLDRRWVVLLILVAALSAGGAAAAAAALGWLLGATLATTLAYAVALWVVLAAGGTALLVLRTRRPARRATLLTLGAVSGVLFCAVPAGTFATFAVDYSPTGQPNPGAAVNAYFVSGPLGGYGGLGRAQDDIDFDRVLCAARRDQLHRQAEAFARTLDRPGIQRIEPLPGGRITAHGDAATVISQIQVTAGAPGSALTYHSLPVTWTFQTVNHDGWQVCQVDAPALCGTLLRCDPTPPSTAPASPSASPSDDLLGGVRDMLPCGPRDPFRDMRAPGECPNGSTRPSSH